MKKGVFVPAALALAFLMTSACTQAAEPMPPRWSISQSGHLLQINYGAGSSFPQYAVLDLQSSYFRMNPGPPSGWGTSIVLLPIFWSHRSCPSPGLCQAAPVQATWQVVGSHLVLSVAGIIGGLQVAVVVQLSPPAQGRFTAQVNVSVVGNVVLDHRPGEAFKPVFLSSMHVSSSQWDTQAAYVREQRFALPGGGWIMQPPVVDQVFGLQGGTSTWKTNAPTMQVTLNQPLQVTGYVTPSSNPNDDNIGFWAAADQVLQTYSYQLTAAPASILPPVEAKR